MNVVKMYYLERPCGLGQQKLPGINECEYLTDCEPRTYSKYCICKECSIKQEESFHNYQQSFAAKTMKYSK